MVDEVLVKKLIVDLREKKQLLERKQIKSLHEFRSDPFLYNAIQHILEVMVEMCMDIGNHIIADEGWSVPSSSREIFEVLRQNNIISEEVMSLAKKMVGFRNIIVHMYEKVNLEEVYAIYRKHLKDFEMFASEIEKYLSKNPDF